MQEKEKEESVKEQEENYEKFRQLLDYEDVSWMNFNIVLKSTKIENLSSKNFFESDLVKIVWFLFLNIFNIS